MKKYAQISTEFIVIIAIFLIIFLVLAFVASHNMNISLEKQKNEDAIFITNLLSSHINNVFVGGHGTSTTVLLPQLIARNTNYNVIISPDERRVNIDYGTGFASSVLQSSDIAGTIGFDGGSKLSIENQRDQIVISII